MLLPSPAESTFALKPDPLTSLPWFFEELMAVQTSTALSSAMCTIIDQLRLSAYLSWYRPEWEIW